MAKAHLTVRNVPSLAAVAGRPTEWFDDTVPGFYIRVSPPSGRYPQGVRAFGLLYRVRGRQFRMNLGRHPIIGLADARDRAREVLAAAQLRGENLARDRRATDLAGIMDLWVAATAARKAPATVLEQRRIVKAYVRPARAGGMSFHLLRRSDLQELVAELVKTAPIQALRIRQTVRSALRWALAEEIIDRDPSVGWAKPAHEATRERVLHDAEVALLWKACAAIRQAAAGAGRLEQEAALAQLLLLLAQRAGETGLMRWQDLDVGAKVWLIPGRFRKGGRTHAVPLPRLALELLEELRPFTGAGERVLPAVKVVDRHWIDDVRDRAREAKLLEHWTPHDLRRTAATGLARDGTPREIIALVLGHVIQAGGAVTGVYDRFDRLPERAAALEAWASRIEQLVGYVRK